MKSVKVLRLFIMRPASCHFLPNSPPPRMWATAKITPRSTREKRFESKPTSMGMP